MDTNEIKVNEDVMEVNEDVTIDDSRNDLMIGVGIGIAAVFVGKLAFKHIAKPIMTKIKDKKKNHQEDIIDADGVEIDESDEDSKGTSK